MKKNRLLQKAALLCAAALALPFCLGAAPESAPGGGGDTVLVAPRRGDAPAAPGIKNHRERGQALACPFLFWGNLALFPVSVYTSTVCTVSC